MRRTGWALAIAVAAALVLPIAPGLALYRDDPIVISPQNPLVEKDYGPLAGSDTAFFTHPLDCMDLPMCDTIPVILNVPTDAIYVLQFTMTWPDEAEANDLDVYLWREFVVIEDDGSETVDYDNIGSAASAGHPEVGQVADELPTRGSGPPADGTHPAGTFPDGENTNKYWFTPDNWAGTSSFYTIKVEYRPQVLPDLSRFQQEQLRAQRRAPRDSTPPLRVDPGTSKPDVEVREIPEVNLPGETGDPTDQALTAVEGEEIGPVGSNTPVIIGIVAILLLAGALFGFFHFRTNRRAESQ